MGVRSERGFTLIEVLVAAAVFATAIVPLLYVAAGAQRLSRAQSEATDLHQRLRVGVEKLRADLSSAGAGSLNGPTSVLGALVPAIVPARTGLRMADAEMSAFADRVTVVYAPDDGWEAKLGASMADVSSPLGVDASAPGCDAPGICGFTAGTRALLADPDNAGAGYELFTVTDVAAGLAHGTPNRTFTRTYGVGDVIIPVVQRVYYFDRAGRRLMVYDGHLSDQPLIDNVVDLRFEYFGDAASGLRPLTLTELTDGPAFGVAPNIFDADLFRIRLVRVTLRVQADADDVRGNGPWFSRPGRSPSAFSYVPDYEVSFEVAPRNLLPIVRGPS